MSKIDTTAQEIIVKLRTITTLANVPDYPPEQISSYPFVVVYPAPTVHKWNTAGKDIRSLHQIVIELHVSRYNLPWDTQQALIYAESIPLLFFSMVVNSEFTYVDTFLEVEADFGELNWGETKTMGFRWRITDLKIRTDIP